MGLVKKEDVESMMSDITHLNPDTKIPYTGCTEVEPVLEVHQKYGIIKDQKKVLPVVNDTGEINEFWTQSQIVQIWNRLPSIKNWSPAQIQIKKKQDQLPLEPDYYKADIHNQEPAALRDLKEKLKGITVRQNLNDPVKINIKNSTTDPEKDHLSDNIIATVALETLPIPMMALDTKGSLLFYNQEWKDIELQNPEFNHQVIMNRARDIMAKLAFEGKLSKDSVIKLESKSHNLMTEMKSLQKYSQGKSQVFGYLFWIIPQSTERLNAPIVQPHSQPKKIKPADHHLTEIEDYYGKTLRDILLEKEKKVLLWAMKESDGNQTNAAMLAGIPRQTFAYRYNKLIAKENLKTTRRKSEK